ncbi:efflux RND transporter periplasmic adaptor subunit [Tolumonas osonensis]|uniref:RND family efflux transporter MFP subunit n=1 Tax=Tolumonas osonensis TaxID=675874 RepID=A0A841GK38_9GAMM|nr:efflux RND transporter periplasmic adaptor subunit [Tolumonas osonensis]MBB6055160.1 RND family efflux transporter MFP subunit [Tolumonas osonensis]
MRYLLSLLIILSAGLAVAADTPSTGETLTVQPTNIPDWFIMDGRIEPVDQGTVSAQTSGRISAITVDVNDVVPAGHLLIEITNTSQTAGLDQAKAAVKAAEARYADAERQRARLVDLVKKGSISRREYDSAATEAEAAANVLKQAKAELVRAGENLGYTRVVAPYAGVVSGRHVSLGETVNPGQLLLSGYAFENMRVVASLPARYISQLKETTPLQVTFPDGQTLTLPQHQLFQFADPASHSFTLRANLPKQETPIWRNGTWVKLAMPLATKPKLLIPEHAVLRQNELSAVYLAEKDSYVLRQVRLGRHYEDQIEILSGLNAGDVIARDAYTVIASQGGHYAP